MTWLVFAVSAVLALAGVASIVSGAPIIQIERGWAEVISGAVAVSGGAISFAIGAVLVRLRAIHRAVAASERPSAALPPGVGAGAGELGLRSTIDETVGHADLTPALEIAPQTSAVDDGGQPAEVESEARHGLWKRIRDLDDRPVDEEHRQGAKSFAPADLTPIIPVALPELQNSAPAVDVQNDERTYPVVEVAPPQDSVTSPANGGSIDWLDHGLLASRPPRPPFFGEDLQTQTGFGLTSHADHPKTDEASASEQLDETGTEQNETLPEPQSEEVTVIGRYKAGVASYVMYSDGTIEVETEGGELRRFGSMDELKTFIAKQDTPVG